MTKWSKYPDLEPIRRLRYEGRELLGKEVFLTEKRDGENVSLWLDDEGNIQISSRNLVKASTDITSRMKSTPEYERVIELLNDFKDKELILYGELLKRISPTRIEPRRKNIHWVLFDILYTKNKRFLHYTYIHQLAYQYKIPIVRLIEVFTPVDMDDLFGMVEYSLKWCGRHHREGLVGKVYGEDIFFKEKRDLPRKLLRIRHEKIEPKLPVLPPERIRRALEHAYDIVGAENWKDKSIAMPEVAKQLVAEAREHRYRPPKNMYKLYLEFVPAIESFFSEGKKKGR